MLLFLLLLVLLFGSLGVLVAKAFFIVLVIALVLSLVTGSVYTRRR
jgi:hypothetical protein